MIGVLILGANGELARHTIPFFLEESGTDLTLYLRNVKRLENPNPSRVRVVEGDATDTEGLIDAMRGQDVVYANLAGDMPRQARAIVSAMRASGVTRLIVNRRAIRTTVRRPTLTRVRRLFEGSRVSDFI